MTQIFERGPVTVTVHDDGSLEVYAPQYRHSISKEWAEELAIFLANKYLNEPLLEESICLTPAIETVPSGEITTAHPAPKRRGRPPKAAS